MNYLFTHWLISLAGTLFLGLTAMVLHEFGHLVTSLMVGVKVKSVGLCMKGMYVVREAGPPAKNSGVSSPARSPTLLYCFSSGKHRAPSRWLICASRYAILLQSGLRRRPRSLLLGRSSRLFRAITDVDKLIAQKPERNAWLLLKTRQTAL